MTAVLTPASTETDPEPVVRHGRVGLMVAAAIAGGLACALLLVAGPVAGGREHVITAALLAGFAVGWTLLAVLTERYTDQPQRWAKVPAIAMGATAAVVFVAGRPNGTMETLGWIWPAPLLGLCVWMVVQARRSLHNWTRRAVLYPVIGFLALAAVGGLLETAVETAQRDDPMPGRLIDVGTHRLHIHCTGAGSPTVVLEPGWGGTSSASNQILPVVADHTRVCVYDRAGRGWSDSVASRQDGNEVAADLHTLLQRAGEPGPYVLAGHSFGGLYVMSFAARYPTDVAGMVLIDPTPADAFDSLPDFPGFYEVTRRVVPVLQTAARFGAGRLVTNDVSPARWARSYNDEFASAPNAMEDARALRTFGAKPLIVVVATEENRPGWDAAQERNAHLSTTGELRHIEGASHQSLVDDEADAAHVNTAIVDVVDAVR